MSEQAWRSNQPTNVSAPSAEDVSQSPSGARLTPGSAEAALSVVIVAYRHPELLEECLHSVAAHNDLGTRLEVIVVDNSPAPGLVPWLRTEFPWVHSVPNPNLGFGQANNVGCQLSHGEYLCFLNPDTELIEPTFGYVLARLRQSASMAACGVRLLKPDRSQAISFFWTDSGGILRSVTQHALQALGLFIPGLMCTSGAALFVRTAAFIECGGFDERIFMYNEEPDLSRRLRARGYRWGYLPGRSIVHHEGGTADGALDSMSRRVDSLHIYCSKYGLSYEGRLRAELRYLTLKWIALRLLGRDHRSAQLQRALIRRNLNPQPGR